MIRFSRARLVAKLSVLVSTLGLFVPAAPARAFAPEAAAALASRAGTALPAVAGWSPAWGEAAVAAVGRGAATEAPDPEAADAARRFDAEGWRAGDPVEGSPAAAAAVREALRAAFETRDPARIATAAGHLAAVAADLADPFLVTAPDPDEVPGARAAFSDLLEPADLEGLASVTWVSTGDGSVAAISLALESAAYRQAIEDAARNRNDATVAVVRRGRLQAALSFAGEMMLEAWRAAGSPALEGVPFSVPRLRAWPNPARSQATLEFALPAGGRVRVELLDVAGRRVWSHERTLAAGPQQIALPGAALEALAPGLYLARVSAPGVEATTRLVRAAR